MDAMLNAGFKTGERHHSSRCRDSYKLVVLGILLKMNCFRCVAMHVKARGLEGAKYRAERERY